ncbi:MAG: cellulase family glycosylhydrolase [Firmicutes bacterium]|nr:cellulase family glycosylhydrolase [Bacillota bacterium]
MVKKLWTKKVMAFLLIVVIAAGGATASITDSYGAEQETLSFTLERRASWINGDTYFCQIDGVLCNNGKAAASDWTVALDFPWAVKVDNGWSGEFAVSGKTVTVKGVSYNREIKPGEKGTFGMILSAPIPNQAEADAAVDKALGVALLTVSGNKQTAEKPSTSTSSSAQKPAEQIRPEKGTPLKNHGALAVKGANLVDAKGKKYQLKGVSTHGIAWYPEYVNKAAFKKLRDDWGANVIRLAMYTEEYGGYCNGGDKKALKKTLDKGVKAATELGMYVIIDWHILQDGNPLTNQKAAKKFFREISKKYKKYDNIIYEICNEPNGNVSWATIKKYAKSIIPVIHANDPDAVILVGTPTWSQDVDIAAKSPLKGYENIMYSMHFYAATHKAKLRAKLIQARKAGLPVFISEFSICDASGNGGLNYKSADKWFDLIEKYNLSYVGWNLSNKGESSSLIKAGCKKTSGWNVSELSPSGKWLRRHISGR